MQYDSTIRQPRTQDLTGKPFGRWTVVQFAGYRKKFTGSRKGQAYWTCQWCCRTIKDVCKNNLVYGISQSCGCLSKEQAQQLNKTHGMSKLPEYRVWNNMRRRCTDPHSTRYPFYGARGITVCKQWNDFATFYADMGPRPTPKHSIERVRNQEGYSPENCIWATHAIQCRNTRKTLLLTYNGVTQCATDWAREYHIRPIIFLQRIRRHWSIEKALFTPISQHRPHLKHIKRIKRGT